MTAALAISPTTTVWPDSRHEGRMLRLSWHPAVDRYVLSIWRDDACAATFHLQRSDAAELIGSLAQGLAATPSPWSPVTREAPSAASRLRRRIGLDRLRGRLSR